METRHIVRFEDSRALVCLAAESIDLVVTSPPYPMIEMWDSVFSALDPGIGRSLKQGRGNKAFEGMHRILDDIWKELFRVLKPGGFACINIGDATRTIDGDFMLYPNHSRILTCLSGLGFTPLPDILWRKQTNAPNKFMGSGMLPAGAYVTLEHEYILIARKNGKRVFNTKAEKSLRHRSAFFWEERNTWFSDVWFDLKGARQAVADTAVRKRSAAYPLDLPYRLINMYSVAGDTVLDPFLGIGTTLVAALVAGRSSVGFEIDAGFRNPLLERIDTVPDISAEIIGSRLREHGLFVDERVKQGKLLKHINANYGFPVVTSQEKELLLQELISIRKTDETPESLEFEAEHADGVSVPAAEQAEPVPGNAAGVSPAGKRRKRKQSVTPVHQMDLFE